MTAVERPGARLEHRLTRPNASLAELQAAVTLAVDSELASLIVSPWLLRPAQRQLGRSPLRLGTVIGDRHGGQISSVKAYEASKALEHGATQLDFVMNGGALVSGDDQLALEDMLSVIEMAHAALASAGVIIEAAPLSEELVRRACRIAERAGADYVVTSIGDDPPARAISRAALLRDSLGPRLAVTASGRFVTSDEILAAANAGASRISAPMTAALVAEALVALPSLDAAAPMAALAGR
jgi:deoxyribose-phosphate aldolase